MVGKTSNVGGCCTMVFLDYVAGATIEDIAREMLKTASDIGTFLACITESHHNVAGKKLERLGFKMLGSSPAPYKQHPSGHPGNFHGSTMELWMYSSVEHNTMQPGRMAEKFKDILEPKPVEVPKVRTSFFTPSIPGWANVGVYK